MPTAVADNLEGGDSRRALATLSDDIQPTGSEPSRRSATTTTHELPARFRGKSTEQLVEMYTNLESHSGKLASNLGQTQAQLTEALSIAKRNSDLGQNTRTVETPINVVDMLSNPSKALEGFLESHVAKATEGLRTQLSTIEQQLHQSNFNRNHPDAAEIFQDPNWNQFVGSTPLRATLARNANSGNYQSADALLTEWKASRVVNKRSENNQDQREQARGVNLESGLSSGGDDGSSRKTGKTYRRADIIDLMQRDPDKYYSEGVQATLNLARREGRIVD